MKGLLTGNCIFQFLSHVSLLESFNVAIFNMPIALRKCATFFVSIILSTVSFAFQLSNFVFYPHAIGMLLFLSFLNLPRS